ncbi:GNAT family N-acetyltransferase [Vibrio aquimaris]|uniref:Acetyltransferase (GNAT) family protein n=1 Tax=Vibrio aquimaris TaxID=2587862 RepID=A0A5P9CIP3_9VIBR|nr:GNAT family N-acetyltransferase [Vibrio aquimaris]QFT25911.1 Acetyltransferase (GNAT) family protein [Vibrio aquimaris]
MALRAFNTQDYSLLIHWIDAEKLNYQWGGPSFNFPLDVTQIDEHYNQANVFPFIYVVQGTEAGFVELFKVSDTHFRICRVFVSEHFRGQGIAKLMLANLITLTKQSYRAELLSLAVFNTNTTAKRCYESLGFVETALEKGERSWDGQVWDLITMEMRC